MRAVRPEGLGNRIRAVLAGAFGGSPAESESATSRAPPARPPAVPPQLTILDLMEGELATVLPESRIRPAVALMIRHRISSVPVVDAEGRIVGALNESDLMKVFYEPDMGRVEDLMTRRPPSVAVDAPLVDVIDRLMSSDFRRVLIHEDGRLVGVVTRSHVMPALLAALEERAAVRERS